MASHAMSVAAAAAIVFGSCTAQPALAIGISMTPGSETPLFIVGQPVESLLADSSGLQSVADAPFLARSGVS